MRRVLAVLIGAAAAAGAATVAAVDRVPDARLVGTWEGDAAIVVSWTTQRQLHVRLAVAPDGRVTGEVGDARLVDGRLRRNRGRLGRLLHVKTDYIVRGALTGAVIAAEGVTRDAVSIPFNRAGESLLGAVHTSGSKVGGKGRMLLTAGRLELRRAAGVVGAR
jgi:hypothetical protein